MTKVMIYNGHVRIAHNPTNIDNFYQQTVEFLVDKYHTYPSRLRSSSGKYRQEGEQVVGGHYDGDTPIGKLVI